LKISYILICMMLLFTSLFFFDGYVSASTGDVLLTDWDDVASGSNSGTSGEINYLNTGDSNYFMTSSDYALSAEHSFMVRNYEPVGGSKHYISGYWNLTQSYDYINNINFTFVPVRNSGSESQIFMSFRNETGENQIILKWDFDVLSLYWYNAGIGFVPIDASFNLGSRYYLNIAHVDTNMFTVSLDNVGNGSIYNGNLDGADTSIFTSFDHIYIDGDDLSEDDCRIYFDDITIDTIASYDTGDNPSTDSSCFGNIYNMFSNEAFILQRYFEIEYPNRYSGIINYVDLYLASNQQYVSLNVNDYSLYVNGVLFSDVSITQYDSDTYRYRFYDESGATLTKEKPLFEFYYDGSAYQSVYWYIERSSIPSGTMGPFPLWFKEHSESSYFGDKIFNGQITGLFTSYMPCICFHGIDNPDVVDIPSHYQDFLSGSKTDVKRYDNDFSFVYQLSSLFTDTKLEVVFDGSIVYTKNLIDIMGTVPYVPIHIGSYTARLNRSGSYITYYNFTTTIEYNTDFYIYTTPNPSGQCSDYKLYYKYNNSNGKSGAIYEGDTLHNAELISYIDANNTGAINLNLCEQGLKKYILAVITDLGASTLTSISHYVAGDDNSYIYVRDDELFLSDETSQQVSYGNPYFNVPVYIYDNNNLISDITNKYRSNFYYEVTTSGIHNLKMYVNTPDGLLEVCNTSFIAYSEGAESDTTTGILPKLDATLGAIVGLIITFICILVPLLIAGLIGGATRSKVEVPYPVFMLTGSLGVVICTLLGFFPEWVAFFIIIIGVIALVLTALKEGKF